MARKHDAEEVIECILENHPEEQARVNKLVRQWHAGDLRGRNAPGGPNPWQS
jgi:hypothetical protein